MTAAQRGDFVPPEGVAARLDELAVRTVYRKVASQIEVCPYGDRHNVGLYDVQEITIVAEGEQDDVSGYNQGRGTAYWAADAEGRIYYRPYNGFEVGGWRRDDDVAYFQSPLSLWARDFTGGPLTKATPALSGRDDHTERQPCGCKSIYVHDHGCTKFASDHTEEAGR